MWKEAKTDDVLLQQDNTRSYTSAATTDDIHIWDLQFHHIQPTAQTSLLLISTCSPIGWMTSGAKPSVLMKSRLQCTRGARRVWGKIEDGIKKLVKCWQKCIEVG
jgi:hypothetical protein